jgi:PAS domain S-box-containing protein
MTDDKPVILNVDDNESKRSGKRRIMEQAGYMVRDAAGGLEALRVLDDVRPALVLLDVRMPDRSGLEVCRRVKSNPELVDTMILHVTSSRMTSADRVVELEVGSDGYLVEPVDQDELLASIRSLLRLRDRQRENQGLLKKLRRSEEQFRGLFEQAAIGMCVVGSDGRFLRVNDKLCTIAGRTAEDLLTRELRDLSHPADRAEHEAQVGKLLLGGVSEVSLDQRLLRPDGSAIWVTVTLSIQWDIGGRILSLIGVVEDIDVRKRQRKEWTDELERRIAERTKELVRTHDRLRGLAQELTLTEQRERQRMADELHDYLAQMLVVTRLKLAQSGQAGLPGAASAAVKDADELIDRCLTYTRTLVAELMPPTLRQFGLSGGLRWLAEVMAAHGLDVEVQAPPTMPPLSEDHTRLLYQSVRELLFNVLKHSGTKHALITLTVDDHTGKMEIAVRDEGEGCHPAKVMEMRKATFGLFSIRERMEAMGGWMEMESRPGWGTTVTLGLTLHAGRTSEGSPVISRASTAEADDAASSAESGRSLSTHYASRRIRVLLVDDHAMVRQGIRSLLDGHGDLDVIAEAGDGEEAVSLALELKPDLVVMDVNLPGLDGIEATKRIRKDRPATVIVGISVNQAEHVMDAMKEAGAAAFLTKESAADQLYETIGAAMITQV